MAEKFEYRQTVEIAATPERIWELIATSNGLTHWYAPEARVTEQSIWAAWGPGAEGESKITAWDPPRLLRLDWGGEPLEYTIEPGRLTVSQETVQSAAAECLPHAWPLFLLLLKNSAERQYTDCHNTGVFRRTQIPVPDVFARLVPECRAWGGKKIHFDPSGYAAYSKDSEVASVFVERSGTDTIVTMMVLTYDRAASDKAIWEGIADQATR